MPYLGMGIWACDTCSKEVGFKMPDGSIQGSDGAPLTTYCKCSTSDVDWRGILLRARAAMVGKCGEPDNFLPQQVVFGCCGSKSASEALAASIREITEALSGLSA